MTLSSPAGSPPTPETTPNLRDVVQYFTGVAELMAGRKEGLRRLDLSADGFWTSFFAVVVALPPEALSWIEFETSERVMPAADAGPLFLYAIHAITDLIAWLIPIAVLMALSRRLGLSRKIAPLVVATNWGSALIAWVCAPYWLIAMVFGTGEATMALGTLIQIAAIALTVRMTATATGLDFAFSLALVMTMWVVSLIAYAVMMDATGLALV